MTKRKTISLKQLHFEIGIKIKIYLKKSRNIIRHFKIIKLKKVLIFLLVFNGVRTWNMSNQNAIFMFIWHFWSNYTFKMLPKTFGLFFILSIFTELPHWVDSASKLQSLSVCCRAIGWIFVQALLLAQRSHDHSVPRPLVDPPATLKISFRSLQFLFGF